VKKKRRRQLHISAVTCLLLFAGLARRS